MLNPVTSCPRSSAFVQRFAGYSVSGGALFVKGRASLGGGKSLSRRGLADDSGRVRGGSEVEDWLPVSSVSLWASGGMEAPLPSSAVCGISFSSGIGPSELARESDNPGP